MYALLLSLCMSPVNASGQEIGPEVCEEHYFSEYKTLAACVRDMDKHIQETNRGPFAPYDWMFSCEKTK